MTRVAIIEYHSLVRRGLESLLSGSPVLGPIAIVAEPVELDPAGPRPDVIVLGPSPDTEESLGEVIGKLAELGRVLVVADFGGRQPVTTALRAGARGCVTRDAGDDELLCAITTVARGGVHIAPGIAARLHAELRLSPVSAPPALARRELETLRWLAAGLTHRQIARRMMLTEATVSTYVKRIRNKLGVGNKADMTRKAFELGLFPEQGDARDTPSDVPPRIVR